ncbi:vacuolar membrane protein-domain-containing protein [Lactarius deliciosus]|nr:vacuolar membrane protein-domain-containing protein [Lactarius deliciosus]
MSTPPLPPSLPPPPSEPGGVFDDYPVDRRSCQLLGPTALIVQALMGVLVISSLLFKRHREKPKRPWRIWLFDVSKQVVGQMFVHGVNVFVSDVGSTRTSGNACVYYFLNILLDTTLGVYAIYITLFFLTWYFSEKLKLKGLQSGQYGSPPSVNYWVRQLAIYVVSLTSMKLFVIAVVAFWDVLSDIAAWLLSWLGNGDTAQVIFTMGLFPIFMNIIQFWVIDSIIKVGGIGGLGTPPDEPDEEADHEPLFHGIGDPDDDEDEDDSGGAAIPAAAKRDVEAQARLRHSADSSHTYPPSLPDSPTAPSTTIRYTSRSPPPISRSLPLAQRHHSPPAPFLPRSTTLSLHSPPSKGNGGVGVRMKEDWQTWDGEDWADRVGEEEWTGRRAEAKKGEVDGTWRAGEGS